jgi:hypothetical protein
MAKTKAPQMDLRVVRVERVDRIEYERERRTPDYEKAGEGDQAYGARFRREKALIFAKNLVLHLDETSGDDADEQLRWIVAAEKARATIEGPQPERSTQATRIRATFEAIEIGAKLSFASGRHVEMEFRLEDARRHAISIDPALATITRREWVSAIERWPGSHTPMGRPKKDAPPTWKEIVFGLLSKHGLTGASDAAALARTWSPPK